MFRWWQIMIITHYILNACSQFERLCQVASMDFILECLKKGNSYSYPA